MRYDNPELQELLASDYAVGNLRGAARRRLVSLMARDPALRERVERWEERMYPLVQRMPKVNAPVNLWPAIHARISPRAQFRHVRKIWWTGFASALAACLLLAVLVLALLPAREAAPSTIALLLDERSQPAILVSWTPRQVQDRQIAVHILAHPDMPAGTSWEAWLVPSGGGPALSLGLVTAEPRQLLLIPPAAARLLPLGGVIGVSVEPKGGARSGRPGGSFLFQGNPMSLGA